MYELSPEEQEKNKAYQFYRLVEYLNEMPVIQIMVDGIEADDVIAVLARSNQYTGRSKLIVSSDKDFLQLCDEETVLYRPIQDTIVTQECVISDYGIHPNNFALARAIAGDTSDNIKGVPRVGLGTVKKRFPFMIEAQSHSSQDLVEHCKQVPKLLSCHKKIIEHSELIQSNYSLMQLYNPTMSLTTLKQVLFNVENFIPEVNFTTINGMMIKDGLAAYRFDDLYAVFRRIAT
tara:strand:- start:1632 stop:2330 length:699 start_codon:yes stop_codon:yes gene_type:complete